MKANIWVTGSAGFLGSRLVSALILMDYRVVGLSRRESKNANVSALVDLASAKAPAQLHKLGQDFGYPEVIIHAASRQPGRHSLSAYLDGNVLTTMRLLEFLEEFVPRQIIYTSTLSVYGRPNLNPVRETDPARGASPYALTKRWAEQLLELLQNRTQVIILRLPSLYGAGQDDSFIDGLARLAIKNDVIELFGRGQIVRDVLHVDDVVAAMTKCITAPPESPFCCMNLGCGERFAAHDYARSLVEALGSRSPIVPVDRTSPQQFDLYADIQEAHSQIGFSPTGLMASMERYAHELRAQY